LVFDYPQVELPRDFLLTLPFAAVGAAKRSAPDLQRTLRV
jgi:hypothetical protein